MSGYLTRKVWLSNMQTIKHKDMKIFTKEIITNAIAAFIIFSIFEIIYDLLTGVTLAEMMSVKYIVIKLICTILFAIVFVAVFKLLNLPLDPSKKGKQ